jgi:DNA-directed RNA polymerase specialized sigma24 family protein
MTDHENFERMSEAVAQALLIAQGRIARTSDLRRQHRLELAMDFLLTRPSVVGEPEKLLDEALAQARTKIRRRAAICAIEPTDGDIGDAASEAGGANQVIEIIDAVRRAELRPAERAVIGAAILDEDPCAIAERQGIPVRCVRERLARARAHARDLRTEMAC